jgi:mono/diheme cytochrome c family protein
VESPEGYLYISTSQQDPVEGVPRTGDDDDLILRIVPATVPNPGHPVYVSSQPDIAKNSAPSGSTEALIAGKCAACHGLEMRNGMPLSVTSNQWVYPLDDAAIRNIIRNGISEKGMPPASDLNDGEISSLVKYLRAQSKSNKH